MPHPRFEPTSFLSSQFSISLFIHHSNQTPPFSTVIHFLIHPDLMANGWHRVEPLPRSHVPICLGGALIATFNLGRRHRHGLDREPDVWESHFHFISSVRSPLKLCYAIYLHGKDFDLLPVLTSLAMNTQHNNPIARKEPALWQVAARHNNPIVSQRICHWEDHPSSSSSSSSSYHHHHHHRHHHHHHHNHHDHQG